MAGTAASEYVRSDIQMTAGRLADLGLGREEAQGRGQGPVGLWREVALDCRGVASPANTLRFCPVPSRLLQAALSSRLSFSL